MVVVKILTTADKDFDVICCSVGTGGTLLGLIQSAQLNQKILTKALRHSGLERNIERFTEKKNWEINHNYVFGGYAKLTLPLIEFINHFNKKFKTPLDPIYTGKLLFGIFDLIKQKQWNWGNRILVIHTGGLQGIAGMNQILSKRMANNRSLNHFFTLLVILLIISCGGAKKVSIRHLKTPEKTLKKFEVKQSS